MPIEKGWRIGVAGTAASYIEMPEPQIGAQIGRIETGGTARSVNGTLLRSRRGTPKRTWNLTLDPYSPAVEWLPLIKLHEDNAGALEMYDPTVPNQLDLDARLGADWVTSAGVAVTATANGRMAISASPSSVQTAISTAPAAANLFPVFVSTQYTAAITVEAPSSFTGTLGVYGYTSTPSGSGTLQGSTTALTTAGRYTVTFTTGGTIVYVELRAVRTAGSATLADPSLFRGASDAGKGWRSVMITNVTEEAQWLTGNLENITLQVEEV